LIPPVHVLIKRLLLLGSPKHKMAAIAAPVAPACLEPLIAACASSHQAFDLRAIRFGDRYRSAYWSIYMLSATASLLGTLAPALGWDQANHGLHPYAGIWGVAEVMVIGCVGVVYWRGHKERWQEQWLVARTCAELAWYLPLIAPLVDFDERHSMASWYGRVFNPGQHLRDADEIDQLCTRLVPQARAMQAAMSDDPAAMRAYAAWAIAILQGQRQYHQRVSADQHQLLHRVHSITACLFALTAVGAALHLFVHALWLSVVTIFFPSLGAALHGALAQSEAFRLEQSSKRLVESLGDAIVDIELAIETGLTERVADAVQSAVAVILEEHQDWHGTVRPHHIQLG
jgi:hypothetical protein